MNTQFLKSARRGTPWLNGENSRGPLDGARSFLKAACLLGALSVIAIAANAQVAVAKASVPFEFAAGGAMLPAGDYTIEAPDSTGAILVRGSAGNLVVLLTTASGSIPNGTTARLIFERRDGMAYLAAVEWPEQNAQVMSVFQRVTKGAATAALR